MLDAQTLRQMAKSMHTRWLFKDIYEKASSRRVECWVVCCLLLLYPELRGVFGT
jgi:hypothetical protein